MWAVAAIAVVLCATAVARAQLTGLSGRSSSVVITEVWGGWGTARAGTLDTWTPVRVKIDSGGEAFAGLLDIEYTQDGSQRGRLRVNVSITPGAPGVARFLLPLFSTNDDLSITLFSDRGAVKDRVQFGMGGMPLDMLPVTGGKLIASIIDEDGQGPSLDTRFTEWATQISGDAAPVQATGAVILKVPPQSPTAFWRGMTVTAASPRELDPSWASYDGLAALILRDDVLSQIDPRALEGVRRWVERGGLLIIVASAAGSDWRSWLPEGSGSEWLTIEETVRIAPPRELVALLEAPAFSVGGPQPPPKTLPSGPWPMSSTVEAQAAEWGENPEEIEPTSGMSQWGAAEQYRQRLAQRSMEAASAQPPATASQAAAEIACRPIALTPASREAGWRLRLPLDDQRGVAASGPVGLGTVVVLGFDPRAVPAVVDLNATHLVWAGVLEPLLKTRDDSAEQQSYGRSSGRDRAEQLAIQTALDRCATTPPIGDSAFYVIAASLLGMAILIGPFDAFVLRRMQARHRSWITASAWIGVAAAVAYLVPEMLRFGESAARRVSIIDVVQNESGTELAWQTSLTGVFSGGPLRCTIEDAHPRDDATVLPVGPLGGTWWRGVSSVMVWQTSGSPRLGGIFTSVQAEPPGMSAAERSGLLAPMTMSQWTFRTLMDEGPTIAPFRAGVRLAGDEWEITLEGLPEGAAIQAVSLRLPDGFRDVDLAGPVERPGVGSRVWRIPVSRPPAPSPFEQRSYDHWNPALNTTVTPSPISSPGRVLDVPGAINRPRAIHAKLRACTHACVYVALGNMTPDIRIRELPRSREEADAPRERAQQSPASSDEFIALSRDVVARMMVKLGESESRQAATLPQQADLSGPSQGAQP